MTESADKTEGLQAALHNSAAAQQCEQFSVSPSRLSRCPTWSLEPAEVSESQTSPFHFFFFFLHNGSSSFSYTNTPEDFLIYSTSALICNIPQLLLLTHALLKSLLRLLNLQEKVCQSKKALQHWENKNVLLPSQANTQYLLLQACFRGPLLRVDQPSPAGQSTTSRWCTPRSWRRRSAAPWGTWLTW